MQKEWGRVMAREGKKYTQTLEHSFKQDVSIKSPSSELRQTCRREGKKTLKVRGDGGHQENKVF